jgi:hypothetical protein
VNHGCLDLAFHHKPLGILDDALQADAAAHHQGAEFWLVGPEGRVAAGWAAGRAAAGSGVAAGVAKGGRPMGLSLKSGDAAEAAGRKGGTSRLGSPDGDAGAVPNGRTGLSDMVGSSSDFWRLNISSPSGNCVSPANTR